MKPMRERITEYSNGDNLDLFWRLFRLRERSGIRIGDGVKIGAGAVVHTDVPAGSTVVAPPPRIIRRE